MPRQSKKVTTKKPDTPELSVTLEMAGSEFKSTGKTTFEALNSLPIDYTGIKTKGVISLQKGNLKSSKLFYLRPLRRVMANRLRKAQVARDLEYLLK